MNFGQEGHNIKMKKPGKFHPNPMHGFLENYQDCSSGYYTFLVQISWESNLPIARYAHLNFHTFVDEHE